MLRIVTGPHLTLFAIAGLLVSRAYLPLTIKKLLQLEPFPTFPVTNCAAALPPARRGVGRGAGPRRFLGETRRACLRALEP